MVDELRPLREDESPSDIARDGYNQAAESYLAWTTALPSPRVEWMHKLYNLLDLKSANVLELGCGAGIPCLLMTAERVQKLTGVDISSTQLDMARKTLDTGIPDKVELVESDMLDLMFADCQFDAIYAIYSIIHLSSADQVLLLQRIFKWLKPGGYLMFNVTSEANEGEVMVNWLGMNAFWAGLGWRTTLEEVKEIVFEVVEHELIQPEGDTEFCWIMARRPISGSSQ